MVSPEYYEKLEPAEVIQLADSKDVDGLVQVLKYNTNKNAVKLALFALGEIGDERAVEPLIDKLLKSQGIVFRVLWSGNF